MDNILIILTATVNIHTETPYVFQTDKNERLECYLKSIKQWIEKTSLKICVVENSGYTFPELDEYREKYSNRFEIITFNHYEIPDYYKKWFRYFSKGINEIYSIQYAYSRSKFTNNIFIIKITGRYFVPEFENFLINNVSNKIMNVGFSDDNIIALRQNSSEQDINFRCEIIGISQRLLHVVFELDLTDNYGFFHVHIESVYTNRLKMLNQDKIVVCPLFKIEPTRMGGVDQINTEL